ncbi:MAG: hypothetical protein L0387_42315, partial [Acidobacteria bacterium]|nr:hypothetical protein [Acidobacteriota bacterium]
FARFRNSRIHDARLSTERIFIFVKFEVQLRKLGYHFDYPAQERSTGARLALARDLQGQAYPTAGVSQWWRYWAASCSRCRSALAAASGKIVVEAWPTG